MNIHHFLLMMMMMTIWGWISSRRPAKTTMVDNRQSPVRELYLSGIHLFQLKPLSTLYIGYEHNASVCWLCFRLPCLAFSSPPNFHNGPSLSEGLLAHPLLLGPTDGQDQSVSRVSDSIVSPFWASRPLKQPAGWKTYDLPLYFVSLKTYYWTEKNVFTKSKSVQWD